MPQVHAGYVRHHITIAKLGLVSVESLLSDEEHFGFHATFGNKRASCTICDWSDISNFITSALTQIPVTFRDGSWTLVNWVSNPGLHDVHAQTVCKQCAWALRRSLHGILCALALLKDITFALG